MADTTLSDKTSNARQDPAAQPTIQAISAFSGPLPTPSDLERYGKIIPNGVERIVAMAEKEQEARLSIAKQDSLNETAAQQARATALKGAIYLSKYYWDYFRSNRRPSGYLHSLSCYHGGARWGRHCSGGIACSRHC